MKDDADGDDDDDEGELWVARRFFLMNKRIRIVSRMRMHDPAMKIITATVPVVFVSRGWRRWDVGIFVGECVWALELGWVGLACVVQAWAGRGFGRCIYICVCSALNRMM